MRIIFILAFCLLSATLNAQVNRLIACAITPEGLYFNKQKVHPRGTNASSIESIADSIPVRIARNISGLGAIQYTGGQFEGLDVLKFIMIITPENGDKIELEGKSSTLNEQMINALKQIKSKSRISFEFMQYSTRDEPYYKGTLSVLNFIVY